jgi:hypothetical protein
MSAQMFNTFKGLLRISFDEKQVHFIKITTESQVLVAHTCNSNYLRG